MVMHKLEVNTFIGRGVITGGRRGRREGRRRRGMGEREEEGGGGKERNDTVDAARLA
jgi:hypothetical protein